MSGNSRPAGWTRRAIAGVLLVPAAVAAAPAGAQPPPSRAVAQPEAEVREQLRKSFQDLAAVSLSPQTEPALQFEP